MSRRKLLAVTLAMTLAFGITACGSDGGDAESNDVMIGATLPMTGDGAAYGKTMSVGLQAAVNVLNDTDQIPGVTFKLKVTDSQAEPGLSVTQMTQLVNVDKAVAIVSAFTTPPLAQLKPAEQYQVPVLNGGGNDPSLLGHEWLFNNVLSSTQEEKAGLQYVKENMGVKRVALLIEGDYTQEGIQAVADAAEDLFPGNTYAQTVDITTTDPTPYINKALEFNPDAIYVGLPGAILDQTLKQLGSQGVTVPLITGSQAFALPNIEKHSVIDQLIVSRQAYNPTDEFLKAVGDVDSSLKPDLYTGTYYTLGMQIAAAVKDAMADGSIDGAAIQRALSNLSPVDGCCGATAFTPEHGTTSDVELVKVDSAGNQTVVWTGPAPAL